MNLNDWLKRGKGAVRATGRALGAVNPFDPRNTNRAGQAIGNFISRSKRAEDIVNAIGRRGGSAAAGAVRDLTGVGGFQRGATKAQQGDIRGALTSAAGGALNLGLSASGLNAARGTFLGARAAGRGVMSSAARGAARGVFGDPLSKGLRTAAAGRRLPVRAAAGAAGFLLPGSPFERAVVTPLLTSGIDRLTGLISGSTPSSSGTGGARTSGRTADQWERILGGGRPSGASTFVDGGTTTPAVGETPVAGVPTSSGAFTVPGEDLGAGMFGTLPYEDGYTTMSGLSQGAGGARGAGGYSEELAALSPEEMQELLEASRDAQRQYDEIINQIGRTTAETERDFFDYTRGVNRQVAGGRQNVASQLAQLGMDTSPATQAYAEYLGAQGQRQIAGGRANVAKILADLRGQRGTAEANKLRRLRELDMAMRNARARRTVNRAQY